MKKLEKSLKYILLKIVLLFLPSNSPERSEGTWKDFKRILIFRLDNRLGNSILILSLVQSIKKSLPGAEIDVMMAAAFNQVYGDHPDITRVIAYDQKYLMKNPLRYIGLMRDLRKNRYDVVFSSSNPNTLSVSQAIFARLITAGRSVGFDWKNSAAIYSDVVRGDTKIHYALSQADLWRYFDPGADIEFPRVYLTAEGIEYPGREMLLWLGATGNKILPESVVAQIIDICRKKGILCRLAAGPADGTLIRKYAALEGETVNILQGSIKGTAHYFQQFAVICMPDTGPMHLAAALDIPLVQLFYGSDAQWYGYPGKNRLLFEGSFDKKRFTAFVEKYLPSRMETVERSIPGST